MADRVYEGIKRDIFYIVGYDRTMDVDSVAARMCLRRHQAQSKIRLS